AGPRPNPTRPTGPAAHGDPGDDPDLDRDHPLAAASAPPGLRPAAHWRPGKNRSISARKCRLAGSPSGSRWLLLSSGTRRLSGISAASNLDCSNRLSGSRPEPPISDGQVGF